MNSLKTSRSLPLIFKSGNTKTNLFLLYVSSQVEGKYESMKQSLIIVYVTLAVLIVIAFFTGGSALVTEGLIISVNTAYKSALMLAASFIIIGQLNVLLTADTLEKWLNKFSG